MEIRTIDPRTAQWEDYEPSYRVYFWDEASSSYEYELLGAPDIDEVITWAEENRGQRTYTMYVVVQSSDGPGLMRVRGTDPTRAG
jgi:hypothetical protein